MKALLCKAFGPASSLVLEDLPSPEPKKNEVLIEVHAAGVNFPDTLIIEGKYQFKPPFPFAPGGEAAGVVKAVGEKITHLRAGDRVMALTGWGGFAEEVAVPGYNVLPVPKSMDLTTAAAFGMTYGTSMHALKQRANLQQGETLLVLGASGGVGLAAVEIGKAMGAKVIAALERALALDQGTLDHERDVIAACGNMSAPTVLFVLERARARGLPPRALLTALGPGFTLSCVALRHAA